MKCYEEKKKRLVMAYHNKRNRDLKLFKNISTHSLPTKNSNHKKTSSHIAHLTQKKNTTIAKNLESTLATHQITSFHTTECPNGYETKKTQAQGFWRYTLRHPEHSK